MHWSGDKLPNNIDQQGSKYRQAYYIWGLKGLSSLPTSCNERPVELKVPSDFETKNTY